ncbi:MAG: hypothetical protein FGM55_15890 [Rhodoferax sp.]|nr:hypothetical protein [Rhodoferax sp.]
MAAPRSGVTGDPGGLRPGRFQGEAAWTEQVRAALATARQQGWDRLILSDEDFDGWPLREAALVADLHAWARPGRRMLILMRDHRVLVQHHPRFVMWRRQWDHLVECRAAGPKHPVASACWGSGACVWRSDRLSSEGLVVQEARQIRAFELALMDLSGVARPAFAATTLGL